MLVPMVTKKINVNNDRIFREIDQYVLEVLMMDVTDWSTADQRRAAAEVIEDLLWEYAAGEDKIMPNTIKVTCDSRNNPSDDTAEGVVNIDLQFQQRNCLNTTKIVYTLMLRG